MTLNLQYVSNIFAENNDKQYKIAHMPAFSPISVCFNFTNILKMMSYTQIEGF